MSCPSISRSDWMTRLLAISRRSFFFYSPCNTYISFGMTIKLPKNYIPKYLVFVFIYISIHIFISIEVFFFFVSIFPIFLEFNRYIKSHTSCFNNFFFFLAFICKLCKSHEAIPLLMLLLVDEQVFIDITPRFSVILKSIFFFCWFFFFFSLAIFFHDFYIIHHLVFGLRRVKLAACPLHLGSSYLAEQSETKEPKCIKKKTCQLYDEGDFFFSSH